MACWEREREAYFISFKWASLCLKRFLCTYVIKNVFLSCTRDATQQQEETHCWRGHDADVDACKSATAAIGPCTCSNYPVGVAGKPILDRSICLRHLGRSVDGRVRHRDIHAVQPRYQQPGISLHACQLSTPTADPAAASHNTTFPAAAVSTATPADGERRQHRQPLLATCSAGVPPKCIQSVPQLSDTSCNSSSTI